MITFKSIIITRHKSTKLTEIYFNVTFKHGTKLQGTLIKKLRNEINIDIAKGIILSYINLNAN